LGNDLHILKIVLSGYSAKNYQHWFMEDYRALILQQTSALYKFCTYLLTYLGGHISFRHGAYMAMFAHIS